MKLKYIYIFLLPLLAGFFALSAFSLKDNPKEKEGNESIIKFSHKLHVDEIDCASCHTAVPTSKSLNDRLLPSHESCQVCHEVDNDKECNTCHYDGVFEPLIQKKANITFNHSFHVSDKKIQCTTCHKGLSDVDYGFQSATVNPSMSTCYSCHNNTVATNSCEACHISTANLKPQSHRSASFIATHKFSAKAIDANCVMCHDNSSCQECHVSTNMITEKNTPSDFYQPYVPNNFIDGSKQQQITKVHDINYTFTHGISAKGKTAECQTCHEIESFCANCHQSRDADFSMGGITPASHLKPNFFTIGVGSGGGEHAILARRDIESCAACHDVQGADPTCITCHLDSDGIKGTNPKTHPANFMRDIRGDWHESQGSICFNCHTSASPSSTPGLGFCGYCHGSKAH